MPFPIKRGDIPEIIFSSITSITRCDQTSNCFDKSDEENCKLLLIEVVLLSLSFSFFPKDNFHFLSNFFQKDNFHFLSHSFPKDNFHFLSHSFPKENFHFLSHSFPKDNYKRKIAPFSYDRENNVNTPVKINVSMSVIDILKIEEVDHIYTLKFRLMLEW